MTNEGKNPGEMTAKELEKHLSSLQMELEDLEEERTFVLGQTGLHVSAREVKNFEGRLDTLRDRIAEAKSLIEEKSK